MPSAAKVIVSPVSIKSSIKIVFFPFTEPIILKVSAAFSSSLRFYQQVQAEHVRDLPFFSLFRYSHYVERQRPYPLILYFQSTAKESKHPKDVQQVYQKNLVFGLYGRSIVITLLAPDASKRLATNFAVMGSRERAFRSCRAYPK